jgi:hypothetical protein
MTVIDDGIRDRFTGKYGPMYRLNDINIQEDGNAGPSRASLMETTFLKPPFTNSSRLETHGA